MGLEMYFQAASTFADTGTEGAAETVGIGGASGGDR